MLLKVPLYQHVFHLPPPPNGTCTAPPPVSSCIPGQGLEDVLLQTAPRHRGGRIPWPRHHHLRGAVNGLHFAQAAQLAHDLLPQEAILLILSARPKSQAIGRARHEEPKANLIQFLLRTRRNLNEI